MWALKSAIIDKISIAKIAATLASWRHTVNDAVLAAGRALLSEDPGRFHEMKVIGVDEHVEVETTWSMDQKIIAAYQHPSKPAGKQLLPEATSSLQRGIPAKLVEIKKLGRTPSRQAADILTHSTGRAHPTAPQRPPTEASNTSTALPWDSRTWPTTSPKPYRTPEDSNPTTPSNAMSQKSSREPGASSATTGYAR